MKTLLIMAAAMMASLYAGESEEDARYNHAEHKAKMAYRKWEKHTLLELHKPKEELNNNHVKRLSFHKQPLTNIDFITSFPHVTELDLGHCHQLSDNYASVRFLPNLVILNLAQTNITTLYPLRGMNSLKSLDLKGNSFIHIIHPITSIPLENLNLSGCNRIADLEKLSRIPTLIELDLDRCFLPPEESDFNFHHNLNFLSLLTQIQNLCLSHNQYFNSVEPLKDLIHLRELNLDGTDVLDLSPLKGLPITSLNIYGLHSSRELTFLTSLTHLKDLVVMEDSELPPLPPTVSLSEIRYPTISSCQEKENGSSSGKQEKS